MIRLTHTRASVIFSRPLAKSSLPPRTAANGHDDAAAIQDQLGQIGVQKILHVHFGGRGHSVDDCGCFGFARGGGGKDGLAAVEANFSAGIGDGRVGPAAMISKQLFRPQ